MEPKKVLFTSLLSEPRESQIQVVILKPAKKKKEKKKKKKKTSRMVKSNSAMNQIDRGRGCMISKRP
ncbi:hypothetical protein VN97_g5648 [Penicillium thymicola]|uniref:Uncharacterized protein n=1 Tax=Penicillium thymicola TaxID=293382 RepID=A0AAI9X916_PENTH|nr:hypothetical protein VN97_g5648 [Penicillium thymicola]